MISLYDLTDAAAVREQESALSVIAAEFVLLSIALGFVVLVRRGRGAMLGMVRSDWRKAAVGGFATGVAYLLVMVAALSAPAGLVSGVRETSVLIAAVVVEVLLREEVTGYQLGMVAAAGRRHHSDRHRLMSGQHGHPTREESMPGTTTVASSEFSIDCSPTSTTPATPAARPASASTHESPT